LIGMPAVGVADLLAEGGDFNLVRAVFHENDAELGTNCETAGKKLQSLFRRSVGCDVVVGRFATEQNVSHATAYEKGLMAVTLQRVANRIGQLSRGHLEIMRLPMAEVRKK
jgi:hypothetical protein